MLEHDNIRARLDISAPLTHYTSAPIFSAEKSWFYLWPTLTFKLQFTPLKQLTATFLENLDKIVKSCVKEFIGLPEDIPNAMIYSPRKFKGLGLVNANWEASLQHINIIACLSRLANPYLQKIIDFNHEISAALKRLKITDTFDAEELTLKTRPANLVRNHLRQQQFDRWCDPQCYPYKHKGVQTFAVNTYIYIWVYDGYGLSTSKWLCKLQQFAESQAEVRTGSSADTVLSLMYLNH